jgi:hypothetical protein
VGLVRAAEYRVEWLGGTRAVTGPKVPYTPVKVGDAEKNAWADQMASRGMIIEMENGRRRTRPPPRPDINRMTWPDVMPAFTGTRSVLAAPNGELCVRRAQPAGAGGSMYDVFDQQGRWCGMDSPARRPRLRRAVFGRAPTTTTCSGSSG